MTKSDIQYSFLPVAPVAGVVDAGVVPNAVVLPNGRIVDEFCKPVPKASGCVAVGAAAAVFAAGVPNVNVEFNVGAAVPVAGVGVEPNRNPVGAGVVFVVDVAPKANTDEQIVKKEVKLFPIHTIGSSCIAKCELTGSPEHYLNQSNFN